jgi:hypothetical protein
LQIVYLIKGIYLEYKNSSYTSILERQNNQIKNGQNIWTDILLKEKYEWLISTWKGAQRD